MASVRADVVAREKAGALDPNIGGHVIIILGQISDYAANIGTTFELPKGAGHVLAPSFSSTVMGIPKGFAALGRSAWRKDALYLYSEGCWLSSAWGNVDGNGGPWGEFPWGFFIGGASYEAHIYDLSPCPGGWMGEYVEIVDFFWVWKPDTGVE